MVEEAASRKRFETVQYMTEDREIVVGDEVFFFEGREIPEPWFGEVADISTDGTLVVRSRWGDIKTVSYMDVFPMDLTEEDEIVEELVLATLR